MSYKINLLFVATAVAAITAMTAPASAGTIYYCKDGTAVSYKSSCKSHGGCCQIAAREPISPLTGPAGQKAKTQQQLRSKPASSRYLPPPGDFDGDGLPERKKGRTFLDGDASVGRTLAGQIPRGRKVSDNENPRPVDRIFTDGAGQPGGGRIAHPRSADPHRR